jgi:hypothetical protein
VGAVLNLLQRPALWTGVFGTHDLFHLFVMAGSLAHYWFILKVVVPFGRGPGEVAREPGIKIGGAVSATSSAERGS